MYSRVPFSDVIRDVSAGNVKIAQSDLLSSGRLAVVDQGKSLVAGYTDEVGASVRSAGPLIVFGDHTRALKFVDFPFAMGADGTKVLQVRDGIHPRYVYWYLHSLQIPSAGYSRHFKFLKEVTVPLPSIGDQRRIAAILDHADALRAKRRQVLAHLDALTQSIFHDMFGSGSWPCVTAAEVMPQMRNGVSPATGGQYEATVLTLSAITRGAFDPSSVKDGVFAVDPPKDKRVTSRDFMMCRGNGNKNLVGAGVFAFEDWPDLVFPDTIIAGRVLTDEVTMAFLNAAWKQPQVRHQIEAGARTTNGTYKVNQQTLSKVSIPLPPLQLQRIFTARVEEVSLQSERIAKASDADDELFASLQSRAFKGEL